MFAAACCDFKQMMGEENVKSEKNIIEYKTEDKYERKTIKSDVPLICPQGKDKQDLNSNLLSTGEASYRAALLCPEYFDPGFTHHLFYSTSQV